MATPTCDVCGQECPPKTLHGMNVGEVGRTQHEFLSTEVLAELATGKRLTACQEPGSNWLWIHPTDADEPRHRERNLSNDQVEDLADGIAAALQPDGPTGAERAEMEAERRLADRRERHFDEHGHFGPGHDPGPD